MLKISLLIIGMISLIFILTSGISIQFKPFHISLAYPYFGTGMVLIAIGFALCFGSAYYHGISNHENLIVPVFRYRPDTKKAADPDC